MVQSLQARIVGLIFAFFLTFGGLVPDTAQAQSCPASAFKGGTISAGSRVRLVALSDADAYFGDRGIIVGKTGRVDQLDPTGGGGKSACWYGGQFYGDDGSSYYFYQVAVEILPAAAVGCPAGSYMGSAPAAGTRVRILTVSADDAYYGSRYDYGLEGGKVGRIDPGWSKTGEPCWFAGQFYGDDGSSFYFYQAAIEIQSSGGIVSGGGTACPAGAATTGMSEGTRVKILGLHPDDAYFPDSVAMVGLSGVVSGDLHSNDGCWMGGGFTADNGAYYYFYKAAVANLGGSAVVSGGSCPAGSYTGAVPVSGQRVRILTVSSSDAYYASRYDYGLEGKVGRVDPGWSKTGEPCWYAGQFYGDDGSSFYFYQAAIELLGSSGAATPAAGDRYMGSAVASGQRFRIVALHPDDAYYSTRAQLIGKHCTATDVMASQGSGWFSGAVKCTDGSENYFYKVGIVLE